jgi:hypothetical protein
VPPRVDQIAELTRDIDLPLPPIHQTHLQFIVEVLSAAWVHLLDNYPKVLRQEEEAAINALMETKLQALREENPLWEQMVGAVARGRETVSFDGAHLEKRPDLSLFLTRRMARFPLIVECKIIDQVGAKTGKLYCEKGLSRFLTGEYAWGNSEALMIAYVRDNSTIASTLAPLLAAGVPGSPPPYAARSAVSRINASSADLATSSHDRNFRYLLRKPPRDEPGAIALWHLWLPATVATR